MTTKPTNSPISSAMTAAAPDENGQSVCDNTLRHDLAQPAGAGLSGYQNPEGGSSATTVARKLRTSIDLAADFVSGGEISGNPDLTEQLQAAIDAAFALRVPVVTVTGVFKISDTILLRTGVEVRGQGAHYTYISASSSLQGKTAFRTVKQSRTERNNDCKMTGISFDANSVLGVVGLDIDESDYFKIENCSFWNCENGIAYNKYTWDTRDASTIPPTYPNANNITDGGMSYFGVVQGVSLPSCTIAHKYYGVVNRCTYLSNSYSNCGVVYDFAEPHAVVESNTYISCNIEGCRSAFEWPNYGENNYSPFSNTWITTSIDNNNTFTTLVKDPGRQTFIGLSLFPRDDMSKVSYYNINQEYGQYSTLVGSNFDPRHATYRQFGATFNEQINAIRGINNKVFGTANYNATIAPGEVGEVMMHIDGLVPGMAVSLGFTNSNPELIINHSAVAGSSLLITFCNKSTDSIHLNTIISATCFGGVSM